MRNKLLIALGCLLLFPVLSQAQRRFHVRGPGVVYVRPYPVYRYYDPFWDPWYYGPGYSAMNSNKGEVKLQDFDKHADVYINGSYAGEVGKVKTMYLDPGSYDFVVKSHGEQIMERRIYVLAGKTVKIKAGVG